ncbi:MAG: hypothetical protein Q9222_005278 [Ikaeria aurantiellina]
MSICQWPRLLDSLDKADVFGKSNRSTERALRGVDLNQNLEALVENPLSNRTPEQLEHDVRTFARIKDLTEYTDLLQKGAKVAKDPKVYAAIRGITEEEKRALQDETRAGIRLDRMLALFSDNKQGANLNFPDAFGLSKDNDYWIIGLVNAAPYIAAALM